MASVILVVIVVEELQPKRTAAASRGSLRQHGFLVMNDVLSISAYTIVAYKILTDLDDNHYSVLHDALSFHKALLLQVKEITVGYFHL